MGEVERKFGRTFDPAPDKQRRANMTDADDLYSLGKAIAHNERCKCSECQDNLKSLGDVFKDWVLTLAKLWASASAGLVLRGLYEGWNDERIAKELSFVIPETSKVA